VLAAGSTEALPEVAVGAPAEQRKSRLGECSEVGSEPDSSLFPKAADCAQWIEFTRISLDDRAAA